MPDFAAARLNMVESQVRPSGITNPDILIAMGELPREQFVTEKLHSVAYVDEDLPLGGGRFLMKPVVLARLLQLADIRGTDKALDIGAGCGYGAAVLARLCHNVIGLESDHGIAQAAAQRLRNLGIRNAWIMEGALESGYAARAPYDVILLSGAVEFVPGAITDQLAEGGRLVGVVRRPGDVGRLTLMTREGGLVGSRTVYDAATGPLPGFARPKEFVF